MEKLSSVSGIYKIYNNVTSESYIGSSVRTVERLHDHMVDLARDCHTNKLLQDSWNKYGPKSFTFSIVEIVLDREALLNRELHWINKFGTVERGFNIKSDQHKNRTVMKIHPETKEELESLGMGSVNATLAQLLKYYKKYGSIKEISRKKVHEKYHGK